MIVHIIAIAIGAVVIRFAIEIGIRIGRKQAQAQLSSNSQLNELAEEFRAFVQGIEGTVPDHVEQALKKLTDISVKALPPASQAKDIIPREEWANLIIAINNYSYDNDSGKIQSVMERFKKYTFTKPQIEALVSTLNYNFSKTHLRNVLEAG